MISQKDSPTLYGHSLPQQKIVIETAPDDSGITAFDWFSLAVVGVLVPIIIALINKRRKK